MDVKELKVKEKQGDPGLRQRAEEKLREASR